MRLYAVSVFELPLSLFIPFLSRPQSVATTTPCSLYCIAAVFNSDTQGTSSHWEGSIKLG